MSVGSADKETKRSHANCLFVHSLIAILNILKFSRNIAHLQESRMTHTTSVSAVEQNDEAMLAELLAGLEDGTPMIDLELDELMDEDDNLVTANAIAADDELLSDIVEEAERKEETQKMYADQKVEDLTDGEQPQTTVDDIETEAAPKKKRETKAKEPKVAAEPKEPKVPQATRLTHKPGDLLLAKLGAKANDFLIFDLNATPEEAEEQRIAFVAKMNEKDAIAIKPKEKVLQLFDWLIKGGELGEVMKRTFAVLAKDGEITSAEKGNLHQSLLSKPYSKGTANSQGCQMFIVLPELGICLKEKGRMIPNPDSPLLIAINTALGL